MTRQKQPTISRDAGSTTSADVAAALPESDPTNAGRASADGPVASPVKIRRRWIVSAIVLAAWILALGILAATTANPVTLNREQILHAHFVVTARVLNRAEGMIAVEKEWKRGAGIVADKMRVENLDRTGVHDGAEYLLPLTRQADGKLYVTETRLPNGRPLAYPATPDAIARLEQLLGGNEAREPGRKP